MLSLYPESIYAGWLFKNEVSGVIEGGVLHDYAIPPEEHSQSKKQSTDTDGMTCN